MTRWGAFSSHLPAASQKGDNHLSTENLSPEVQALLKDLHEELEQLHRDNGHATLILFLDYIHTPSTGWDLQARRKAALAAQSFDHEACLDAVREWCPDENWYFRLRKLEDEHTPAFAFRTCFDFYIEMVATGVRRIFAELIKIGRTVAPDGFAWAKAYLGDMIRNTQHFIADWVYEAAGKQGDRESWQARLFLTMQPAGRENYDFDRAMELMDAASSQKIFDFYCNEYVERLERYIKQDARAARRDAFHNPKPAAIIEKLTKAGEPGAREDQADPEEGRRRKLIAKALNAKTGDTLRKDEVMLIFDIEESTVKYWVKIKKLTRGPKNNTFTAVSVKRILNPPRKKRPHKKIPGKNG